MQTFLPYPNFVASARCLDYRRLGKQRVEGRQLETTIAAVTDRTADVPTARLPDVVAYLRQAAGGWANHPAVGMWVHNLDSLRLYTDCCIREWVRRGYNNAMPLSFPDLTSPAIATIRPPSWLGDERFHSSHRAALLHKDFAHYSQFGWTEDPVLDYVWPIPEVHT